MKKDQIQTLVLALYLVTFASLSLLLLPLYFLNREINQRKQAEEKVVAYQEDLRSYASQLSLAEERERHRIGAHLHDRIGQALAWAFYKPGERETGTGEEQGHLERGGERQRRQRGFGSGLLSRARRNHRHPGVRREQCSLRLIESMNV